MRTNIIALSAILLIAASCNTEESKVKNAAKDFIEQNVAGDKGDITFGNVDSTRYITKERFQKMRANALTLPDFNGKISYTSNTPTYKLLYVPATYSITNKNGKQQKVKRIFYSDETGENIVAVIGN